MLRMSSGALRRRVLSLATGALLLLGGAGLYRATADQAAEPALSAALHVVNNSIYGGRGTDPLPVDPTPVQLRAAEVSIVQVPVKDGWQVSANYDLYNPAAAPAPLSLLLPEDLCQPGGGHDCSGMRGAFQDLGTRFGTQLVEPTQAPVEMVRPWAELPGKGFLYRLTVPPRRPIRFSQEYLYDISSGSEWWGIHYVSSAGRWAGPIAGVKFTVELKQPPLYVIYPRGFVLRQFTEQGDAGGQGAVTRLVFIAQKVPLRTDFLAAFPADSIAGASPVGICPGFRGDQSNEELAQTVRGYDLARLHACADQVRALHGFPFKDPALRTRYYGTPPRLPAWADDKSLAIAAFPENRDFRDTLLSPGERAYIKALGDAEQRSKH
jgi:hypothetical protein